MRLIDLDELAKHEHWKNTLRDLKCAPTVDAVPVVHSRFVNMGGFPACENCGASPAVWEPKPYNQNGFPPYCYNCGAKMDLKE